MNEKSHGFRSIEISCAQIVGSIMVHGLQKLFFSYTFMISGIRVSDFLEMLSTGY